VQSETTFYAVRVWWCDILSEYDDVTYVLCNLRPRSMLSEYDDVTYCQSMMMWHTFCAIWDHVLCCQRTHSMQWENTFYDMFCQVREHFLCREHILWSKRTHSMQRENTFYAGREHILCRERTHSMQRTHSIALDHSADKALTSSGTGTVL